MDAAAQAGGTVVGVLAEALDRRLRKADVRRAVRRDKLCLLTPSSPPWASRWLTRSRANKIIYALARV